MTAAEEAQLEERIYQETSARMKANPARCGSRIMTEVIFEMDPRKFRIRLDPHRCTENCPKTLWRKSGK